MIQLGILSRFFFFHPIYYRNLFALVAFAISFPLAGMCMNIEEGYQVWFGGNGSEVEFNRFLYRVLVGFLRFQYWWLDKRENGKIASDQNFFLFKMIFQKSLWEFSSYMLSWNYRDFFAIKLRSTKKLLWFIIHHQKNKINFQLKIMYKVQSCYGHWFFLIYFLCKCMKKENFQLYFV